MAITGYSQVRIGNTVIITATSGLSGTIYYHWYVDGAFVGRTTEGSYSVVLEPGEQVQVTCQDSNSADYDAIANAPTGYPARRTIWWVRSLDADVIKYRIDYTLDGGAWTVTGTVFADGDTWYYSFLTARLTDLSDYEWRVVPIDNLGNEGTALEFTSEAVVRRPDGPDYTVSFDSGTSEITFTEVA